MIDNQDIRHWYIYKITSPTDRIYIGKTTNFKKRKQSYSRVNKYQTLIHSSIKKYGIENHKFEVIDEFDGDFNYCDSKEMFWIRSFMSYNKRWSVSEYNYDKGLNCTDGGETGPVGNNKPKYSLRGKPLSEETKRKLSESRIQAYKNGMPHPSKGKKLSEERKIQIGLSKVGKRYNLGTRWTQEQKDHLAAQKESKAILQYDLNGNFIAEYRGVREASKKTGIGRNVINHSARGLLKRIDSRRKYIFKYKEQ
jgi:group I intron endonuclease